MEGLRFARLVFVGDPRHEGFTIGAVDTRRQLAMCIWDDERALERFRERSPIGRTWSRDCDEYCELRMTPFHSHGSYRGMEPLANLKSAAAGEGPVALWTFANIPLRSVPYFWINIRRATRRLLGLPGLIAATAGPEHLYTGAMTFTIWQTLDDAVRFAYREPPHKGIVKDVRDRSLLRDSMFIRFRPFAAEGSWPRHSRFGERFERFRTDLGGSESFSLEASPARR